MQPDPQTLSALAGVVLFAHVLVIGFNVFGLIAIPLGAWQNWAFVRWFWWRAAHLASLAIVAVQAVFGRACFLTLWQSALMRQAGETASDMPLVQTIVMRLIFWPLPSWVFVVLYVGVSAYSLLLWWLVPPRTAVKPA
jgi:hypothetical protein